MTGASSPLRALLLYTAILPIALLLGYLLATPLDPSSLFVVALLLLILSIPLMLKWHRPFLFLTWNMTAVLFFLPGRPQVWIGAAFLSFLIVVVQKMLKGQSQSINTRSVSVPLVFLLVVVFVTAKMTGGVGLQAFGSEVVGGKAYFWILAGALGYFAMTASPIPPEKRRLYVGLFLLGALTNAIGSSLAVLNPSLYYIFLLFPVDKLAPTSDAGSIGRYHGLAIAAMAAFYYLLSRHPVRDLLSLKKPVALLLLFVCSVLVMGSGYRGNFVLIVLVFMAVFYFEGLLRSHFALILLAGIIIVGGLAIPLANRLPMPIQRAISVLPVSVSMEARLEAERSTQWRLDMWKAVVPEIPRYFWLGKGIGINSTELDMAQDMGNRGPQGEFEIVLQTGAYHNGALTVLIPFGIWGFIGWMWFIAASMRALYLNHKNGDPDLKTINTLLLSLFCAKILFYFVIFGEFRVDFPTMVGIIGLSLALNGGIAKPVKAPNEALSGAIPRLNAQSIN